MWTLGSWAYDSGYYAYANPYYVETPVVVECPAVNYSEPITVEPATTAAADEPPPQSTQFEAAMASFKAGDYSSALAGVQEALKEMPNDAVLHEFRALVLFAMGDYQPAAAAANAILAVGPGWDWTTLISLYADPNTYTQQLRALEKFRNEHPDDAAARFLLAYHYITCNHIDNAVKELKKVVELQPSDRVAARLLETIDPNSAANKTPPTPPATAKPAAEVKADALVGSWTAKTGSDGTITLQLDADSRFTWTYSSARGEQKLVGTYTVGGNVLTLIGDNGQPMVGMIDGLAEGKFNFKLTGGDPSDPGLNFSK